MEKQFSELLTSHAFSYASVDNVSSWQGHARVHATDDHRGLNCTSYMVGERKPKSIVNHPSEESTFHQSAIPDINGKLFRSINVSDENNSSLFRSIVTLFNTELLHCERDNLGKPVSEKLLKFEEDLLCSLKKEMYQDIVHKVNTYQSLTSDYETIWVESKGYIDFYDRFRNTLVNSHQPDEPEILTLVRLLGNHIQLYNKVYDLLCPCRELAPALLCSNEPLYLLVQENGSIMPLVNYSKFESTESLIDTPDGILDMLQRKHNVITTDKNHSIEILFANLSVETPKKNRSRSVDQSLIDEFCNLKLPTGSSPDQIEVDSEDFKVNIEEDMSAQYLDSQLFGYCYGKLSYAADGEHNSLALKYILYDKMHQKHRNLMFFTLVSWMKMQIAKKQLSKFSSYCITKWGLALALNSL